MEKGPQGHLASRLPNDLDEYDQRENGRALTGNARLVSAYDLPAGATVWVVTEEDRSATTLLLQGDD